MSNSAADPNDWIVDGLECVDALLGDLDVILEDASAALERDDEDSAAASLRDAVRRLGVAHRRLSAGGVTSAVGSHTVVDLTPDSAGRISSRSTTSTPVRHTPQKEESIEDDLD